MNKGLYREFSESELTGDQRDAIECIINFLRNSSKQCLKIGGLAGTGKTSVISHLNDILPSKANIRRRIAYCAFTGKAASVMRSKGMEAGTIHSLIYHSRVDVDDKEKKMVYDFSLKDRKEMECDVIVVDEASTVSDVLYRDIMSLGKKVIFVGDYGQLPPIGNDINLMSEEGLDCKLTKIHRQAEKSNIIRMSMAVRSGDQIAFHDGADTVKKKWSGGADFEELLHYNQILCGYNNTRMFLNSEIRKAYGFKTEFPERRDKMMFLRNDRGTGTFNGEQFVVLNSRRSGDDFIVDYVDIDNKDAGRQNVRILGKSLNAVAGQQSVQITRNDLQRCPQMATYAYAISVHKSQGSQWDNVALWDDSFGLKDAEYRRRFLYTAITRASEKFTWIVP